VHLFLALMSIKAPDFRFCLPHNACFSNIFASPSGTLGEKCKLAHSEPCSMSASGDLERSGRPRGAHATVALVWWCGIELTLLCRDDLRGGEYIFKTGRMYCLKIK